MLKVHLRFIERVYDFPLQIGPSVYGRLLNLSGLSKSYRQRFAALTTAGVFIQQLLLFSKLDFSLPIFLFFSFLFYLAWMSPNGVRKILSVFQHPIFFLFICIYFYLFDWKYFLPSLIDKNLLISMVHCALWSNIIYMRSYTECPYFLPNCKIKWASNRSGMVHKLMLGRTKAHTVAKISKYLRKKSMN